MADPATTLPTAAPAPVAADLATRILELAVLLEQAHATRHYSSQQRIVAELIAAARTIESHLGPVQFEPAERIRETINTDGAAYEIYRDGEFIAVRLYDVTGDDALIHFAPDQAAKFRTDLTRVLLGGAK